MASNVTVTNCWLSVAEVQGDMNDLTSDRHISAWAAFASAPVRAGDPVTFRDMFGSGHGPARVVSATNDRLLLDVFWDRFIDCEGSI